MIIKSLSTKVSVPAEDKQDMSNTSIIILS